MDEFWKRIVLLLGNTLAVSGLTTLLAGALGLLLGIALFRQQLRGGKLYQSFFAAALFFPLHAQVAGWYAVYAGLRFELDPRLLSALLMFPAYLPLMVWITALALALYDQSREEAALLEARPARVLARIVLPECRPVLLGGLLLIFILAGGEVTATDVLRVRTFAEEIFTQFSLRQLEQIYGVAGVLLGLILALTLLLIMLLRSAQTLSLEGLAQRMHDRRRRRGSIALELSVLGAMLLLYGLPLAALLRASGGAGQFLTALKAIAPELWLTGWIALTGAVLTALPAVPLAWLMISGSNYSPSGGMRRRKLIGAFFRRVDFTDEGVRATLKKTDREKSDFGKTGIKTTGRKKSDFGKTGLENTELEKTGRNLSATRLNTCALFITVLLALLPAPVLGYVMIVLFDRPGVLGMIYDSRAILVLTHLARFLPLLILIAAPFVARLPEELQQLGRLEGVGRARFICSVLLPLCRPLMLILGLLAFALICGEVGATALVAPPGDTMLSVRIFTLLHYGVYFDAAAAALIGMIALGTLGALAVYLIRRYPLFDG